MACKNCGSDLEIVLKFATREYVLCARCARSQGVPVRESGRLVSEVEWWASRSGLFRLEPCSCSGCGLNAEVFWYTGLCGCQQCHSDNGRLEADLRRFSKQNDINQKKLSNVCIQTELELATSQEDYERAAGLRDYLKNNAS